MNLLSEQMRRNMFPSVGNSRLYNMPSEDEPSDSRTYDVITYMEVYN
jgi:hypothetical protein